jgi:hypothetical protein
MSWRKTLIIGGVLACLAAFYYLFEVAYLGGRQEAEERGKRVFTLTKEALQGIDVIVKETKKYGLVKEKDGWQITMPVKARGDQQAVEQVLLAVLAARREREIGDHAGEELKAFGLSSPRAEITVRGNNREETVLIGEENPGQTGFFAVLKGDTRVFLFPLAAWDMIDRDVYALRDKQVLAFEPDMVKVIEVRSGGTKLRVQKQDKEWRMTFPLAVKADEGAINQLLNGLNDARVARFVDEAPRDLKPYGLNTPRAEVWFEDAQGKKGIRFGTAAAGKTGVYVQLPGGKTIFEVDKALFALVPTTVVDWRDKEIVAFDNSQVQKWAVHYRGKELAAQKKEPDSWELISPERVTADTAKVTNFLWDIQGIKAVAFMPSSRGGSAYGLRPPRGTIEVWLKDRQGPITLLIGQAAAGRGDRMYVMREGEKEIYEVASSSLKCLATMTKDLQYRRLFSFKKDDVREVEVVASAKAEQRIVFVKKGDGWKIKATGEEMEPWRFNALFLRLAELEYDEEIPAVGNQGRLGLNPPRYEVLLHFSKGGKISLALGNDVPQKKGEIYALIAKTQKTYTIAKDVRDMVEQQLLAP